MEFQPDIAILGASIGDCLKAADTLGLKPLDYYSVTPFNFKKMEGAQLTKVLIDKSLLTKSNSLTVIKFVTTCLHVFPK